jgi:hypothetical protein
MISSTSWAGPDITQERLRELLTLCLPSGSLRRGSLLGRNPLVVWLRHPRRRGRWPPIPIEEAIRRVWNHLRKKDGWEDWSSSRIKVPILQHEYDALSSLAYNKWVALPTVLAKLNGGSPLWIDEFAQWNENSKGEKSAGLSRRRVREMALAYDADYGDISEYGVYEGVPLALKEMRPFPADEPTG